MKKSRILLVVLALILLLSGCASDGGYARNESTQAMDKAEPMMAIEMSDDSYYGEEMAAEEITEDSGSTGEIEDYSKKIIYNANMELVSDDVLATSDQIVDMVNEMGGYVGYLNKSDYSGSSAYVNMQVRVPASGLTDFTDYVSTLATIEYENMSSDNITEQYYDIKTRLEHQKLMAEQLEELLVEAETIEDKLMVRNELSQVQETIEVYEGKIRMWDSLVSYSTVTIGIRKTPTIDDDNGLLRMVTMGETGRAIVRGFRNSAVFIVNFFSFLLRLIAILIIPAVIIVPIVIIIVRLTKKKRMARRENKQNSNEK